MRQDVQVDERLIEAVRAGDADTVETLLQDVAEAAMTGEGGSLLLRTAAAAGHTELVEQLIKAGADPTRPWPGDVEPVCWAADRGAWGALFGLLGVRRSWLPRIPERTLEAALRLARVWLTVDAEQELRRRLGAVDDVAVVERKPVPVFADSDHAGMVRIRVRTGDGRQDQVWTAHRAVVTLLEERLGIVTPYEELADRAMHTGDPESCDWDQAMTAIMHRPDLNEAFLWLAGRLEHPRALERLFAAQTLHYLSFDERPFDGQAVDVLAARVRVESDPVVLYDLIGALGWYSARARPDADLHEILPHARHEDPKIRARVAGELSQVVGSTIDSRPPAPTFGANQAAMATLIELTSDPTPETRTVALRTLADSAADTPQVRESLLAHLDDEHSDARLEAAVGLVLRHDPRGRDVIDHIAANAEHMSQTWLRIDSVERAVWARTTQRQTT